MDLRELQCALITIAGQSPAAQGITVKYDNRSGMWRCAITDDFLGPIASTSRTLPEAVDNVLGQIRQRRGDQK